MLVCVDMRESIFNIKQQQLKQWQQKKVKKNK